MKLSSGPEFWRTMDSPLRPLLVFGEQGVDDRLGLDAFQRCGDPGPYAIQFLNPSGPELGTYDDLVQDIEESADLHHPNLARFHRDACQRSLHPVSHIRLGNAVRRER
jgi:hypothetical protein